ncbi:aldolase/citrate lyase family protein [Streptomyces sp. TG1A-8]|uniref:HpcH/HpaI aldolase family protein n=1 Tax=Streptomyces sp. TG1A-8 TaxID=3051385 RepID=UPI00265BE357|nr:aldolase/citrate lyase family protein [Streptomyces sp. TG1A-8]MDO0925006.1 aldolase/citrate lyase family protein [Streptomyces sp. TG1A-8]
MEPVARALFRIPSARTPPFHHRRSDGLTTPAAHPLIHPVRRLTDPEPERSGPRLGIFLLTGNSMIAELCGIVPLDWVVLDMEASPMTKTDALHMLQALSGSGCSPLVRVPYLDHHLIEHALDMGAAGVMIPKVDDAAAAAAAAAASRFPPEGSRGVNPVRASGYFTDVDGYLRDANRRTVCIVQIESAEAVARVDEIAAVEGIDALFIGMGDLASALGQPGRMTGAAMDEARARTLKAARSHGKQAGIFAYDMDLAAQYAAEGFDLIAFGNEIKLLRESLLDKLGKLAT